MLLYPLFVTSFVVENGAATGVRLEDGSVLGAELVISCMGAWTPCLLPELGDDDHVVASGQYVAHISLTDAEAERLRDMPVCVLVSASQLMGQATVYGHGRLRLPAQSALPRRAQSGGARAGLRESAAFAQRPGQVRLDAADTTLRRRRAARDP